MERFGNMSKKLSELIKMFREAREKATQGEWAVDGEIGQDVFADKTRIVSADPRWNYSPGKISCYSNLNFCATTANHILELTEAAEKMQAALKKIQTGGGRAEIFGIEMMRCPQCASAEIARQVLAEIEDIK